MTFVAPLFIFRAKNLPICHHDSGNIAVTKIKTVYHNKSDVWEILWHTLRVTSNENVPSPEEVLESFKDLAIGRNADYYDYENFVIDFLSKYHNGDLRLYNIIWYYIDEDPHYDIYLENQWQSFRYSDIPGIMMTNGEIFRITGHLCGEFTGPRWISRTKASDADLWCFLWSASE